MPDYTTNYNFIKPKKTENYDIEDVNTKNMDILDEKLFGKADKVPGKGWSTNDFTNEYKNKIDSVQRIYNFVDSVKYKEQLDEIINKEKGDVYNVISENKNYVWNGEKWVETGSLTNVSNIIRKFEIGEWTPQLINTGDGENPTVSYSYCSGSYHRFNNIVIAFFRLRGEIIEVFGDNYAGIGGLPKPIVSGFLSSSFASTHNLLTDNVKQLPTMSALIEKNGIQIQTGESLGGTVAQFAKTENGEFECFGAVLYETESEEEAIEQNQNWIDEIENSIEVIKTKIEELKNYNDTESNQITELQNKVTVLESRIPEGQASGNPIYIDDSTDLEAKFRLNGGSKQEFYLPEEYTQLEYIESTGTQYIDTGYKANQKTEYEVEFAYNKMDNASNYGYILGSRVNVSDKNISLKCTETHINVGRGNNYVSIKTQTNIKQKYKIKVTENAIIRDEVIIDNTANAFGDGVGTENIILFNTMQAGVPFGEFEGKMYYCKIWDNGELVREFIPCKRNSDNVLGMYDTVNDVFYTNAGTGTFIGGEIKASLIETVGSNVNFYNEETAEKNKYLDGDTGRIGSSQVSKLSDYIELTENEYTINYTNDSNTRGYSFYDEEKNFISGKDNNKAPYTITRSENAKYIRFAVPINALDVKLEKGNKATAYSPYGIGSVEIDVCNKNKFKCKDTYTKNGITLTKNKDGSFKIEGTATTSASFDISDYIKIKGTNTYKYEQIKGTYVGSVWFWNKTDSNSQITLVDGQAKTFKFDEYKEIRLSFTIVAGTSYSFTGRVQIEEGNTATDIIEHEQQTQIMPIQQEMLDGDYIEDVEHHTWDKVSLLGQDNWNYNFYQEKENTIYFVLEGQVDSGVTATQIAEAMCNRLSTIYTANVLWNNDDEGFALQGNSLRVRINKSLIPNWNGDETYDVKNSLLRAYLKENNYIFYYKRATPLDLELTEAQKEAQKINTYKNVTNIEVNNSLATLDVTYKKDQEAVNKKYEDRIAALEAAILS